MSQEKYIGMDVHVATISAAVKNAEGKLLMEGVLETKAATILEFIQGLRGTLALTFEEGTLSVIAGVVHKIVDVVEKEAETHNATIKHVEELTNVLNVLSRQADTTDARFAKLEGHA